MLALAVGRSALAAEPGAEARAIEIGRSALDAYARGSWAEAYQAFREAEALAHSPVFVLYMARCRRNAGRLLEARELLRRVASEQLAPDAPAPWQQATVMAHSELGTLQQVIPSLLVRTVHGPALTQGAIDGRSVSFSEQEQEFELDPGPHTLSAGPLSQSVVLIEGRRRLPVILDLAPIAAPRPAAAEAERARTDAGAALDHGPRWPRILGFTLLGVGAAALGAGIGTGLVAKHKTDEIKERCNPSCPSELAPDAERASDWAGLATVSFVVAGTALASGSALLLLVPSVPDRGARLTIGGKF